jgi:hypothetical protein
MDSSSGGERRFSAEPGFYRVRFRAALPAGVLPERFGVVTACNPYGRTVDDAENERATAALRSEIARAGHGFFPVTGGSEDFSHAEPGFGVVADEREVVEMGRRFQQLAVFWVERGRVWLLPCEGEGREEIGDWERLVME